ncbi:MULTISPECIES: DUF2541 family protein [Shewanella]|uniref:DUF2541 family protein n=1 Tax=Shewanella fidelis TaxID=173509 RepID=A0AAW8NJI3_9GAMM|nr:MULTISPECIES: DUF2541 family protein [Shewanella]MDR8522530.1 DUF2541 family protein [Shewanella fidelis]MDW4812936.1 DUF2541 family protein [Shewanella fidelis]MDW4816805.1 DUF2541 family protein [Shewanella fidelis]MDW4820943.1 DUF2541 family protein [Shewanella fidelis]MDW4825522.1 DUF2541 family protein [Shewanella fidelis]
MNRKSLLAGLMVVASMLAVSNVAKADEQITLGRTILLSGGDHGAKIPLLICRKTDAIRVKAERDLHLERIKVTFNNGNTKTIHFHRDLKEDQYTDWRGFGYRRCVKKLEVFGNSDGSKAGVKVLGRKK